MIEPGEKMFKLDLKSGYHHIAVHEGHFKCLEFSWRGKTHECRVLPFGLNVAPFIFVKVTKQLVQKWRTEGIKVIVHGKSRPA